MRQIIVKERKANMSPVNATFCAAFCLLGGIAPWASAAPLYTFTDLGTLNGSGDSGAYAINNSGQVVGVSFAGLDRFGTSIYHASLWNGGNPSALGSLGGVLSNSSYAQSINNNGQVVGYSQASNSAPGETILHATMWNGGTITDLGTLGGIHSFATSINAVGQIAGWSYIAGNSAYHATVWSGNTVIDLGTLRGTSSSASDINNTGQVVGTITTNLNEGSHAALWDGTAITDLGTLGGTISGAHGINDSGQIVGYSFISGDLVRHATIWNSGTIADLGAIVGFPNSYAMEINNNGKVVGFSANDDYSDFRAVIWDGNNAVDLNSLVSTSGWTLGFAYAINDSGQIVGEAYSGSPSGPVHAFLLTPCDPCSASIPEPYTLALLGLGLAGIGFGCRKKGREA
jgi:probable HAF family extracellular repeat protein